MWVRVIIHQFEIFVLEIEDILHVRIDFHLRKRTRFASQLQVNLLQVVEVQMCIANGMDEITSFQASREKCNGRRVDLF